MTVKEVKAEIARAGSGPARAYARYLEVPSDQRLEYLVKAVLYSRKMDGADWQRYSPVVLEASAELEEEVT